MKYGDFKESPLNSTAIKYTEVPFVVFTGSHCKVIDVKVLFLNVGVPGIGGLDPSPFLIDESVFKYFRNQQLAPQLLELVCKIRSKAKNIYTIKTKLNATKGWQITTKS